MRLHSAGGVAQQRAADGLLLFVHEQPHQDDGAAGAQVRVELLSVPLQSPSVAAVQGFRRARNAATRAGPREQRGDRWDAPSGWPAEGRDRRSDDK